MSVYFELHSMTSTFLVNLKSNAKQADRDETIEYIQQFLNNREKIISQIISPSSDEERQLGVEVVEMQEEIDRIFHSMQYEIKKDLATQQKKGEKLIQYVNPYKSLTNVSAFFDKKE
jgi:flagellar protein FliT